LWVGWGWEREWGRRGVFVSASGQNEPMVLQSFFAARTVGDRTSSCLLIGITDPVVC
jgi:hypothetical protein